MRAVSTPIEYTALLRYRVDNYRVVSQRVRNKDHLSGFEFTNLLFAPFGCFRLLEVIVSIWFDRRDGFLHHWPYLWQSPTHRITVDFFVRAHELGRDQSVCFKMGALAIHE